MNKQNNYINEFELISSKRVFRFEDLTEEEIRLYIDNTKYFYNLKDDREIFIPFRGEEKTYLNEDIGVDELRVYRWLWCDHELIDINTWPGDNESGVVAINHIAFLLNSDTDFTFCIDTPYNKKFEKRLDIFQKLRYLDDDTDDDDFNMFMKNEKGQKYKKIEDDSHKIYINKYKQITDNHLLLCNSYYNEFAKISNPQYNFIDVNSDLFKNKTIKSYNVKYFIWNYENTDHIIIHFNDKNKYKNSTYLCDNNYKIIQKIYSDHYLSKNKGNRTLLILELHKRIYSFWKHCYDC